MKKKILIGATITLGVAVLACIFNPFLLMIPMALSGQYSGLRSNSTILEAHERAVTSFTKSKGFGMSRMRHKSLWNERSVLVDGVKCRVSKIQLIGLTDEYGVRYFEEDRPPKKDDLSASGWRAPEVIEQEAIAEIRGGAAISRRLPALHDDLSVSGAFRLLAPIAASQNCLKCHDVAVGDTLGAFAYTLAPSSQLQDANAEQDGADQPATAPEPKSEDDSKPQPESEVRPQ